MNFYIYKIVNKINSHFYIGSTINIKKRIASHKKGLRKGNHHCIFLQRAYNLYGEDSFEFVIREVKVHNTTELRNLEERYISYCWKSGLLYNTSKKASGGDLISYHPLLQEIKKKQSINSKRRYENMTKEDREELSNKFTGKKNPNYGNKWSDELRKRVSEHRKQICLTKTDYYNKGKKIEDIFGKDKADVIRKKISKAASLRIGSKNSFFGKKHTEETKKIISKKNKGRVPKNIKKVEYNGNVYNSASECSKELGINLGTITYRCRNKLYGFYYIED